MPLAILFDTFSHIRGVFDLAVWVQFKFGVDTADVLSADKTDTCNGGTCGEVLPVLAGDVS